MTERDLLLVVALGSGAIAITLADLAFSWWRHWRGRVATPAVGEGDSPVDPAVSARRDAVRRRIRAIQAAAEER